MSSAWSDPTYLRSQQYRDASNLDARTVLHQRFSTNGYDFHCWVFDHILDVLAMDGEILEVGCGSAELWRKNLGRIPSGWHVTLTDFSPGMVAAAERVVGGRVDQFTVMEANTQDLPFADASFDVAIANHMLYHVPNRERALAELRRVLRPGGHLFAATNGQSHMRGMGELVAPYAPIPAPDRSNSENPFSLENGGEQLARHFSRVSLDRYEDELVITEAGPLLAYTLSMPMEYAPSQEQIDHLASDLANQITAKGAIHIQKETGLFIAS
jgi:SAM-dependent methyltransferase